MSSRGVPSPAEHLTGRRDRLGAPRLAHERRLGAQGAQRRRGDAAQTDPGGHDDAVDDVEGEGHGHAGDVVEAPLGDLVEAGRRGEGQRDPDRPDQLVGLLDGGPVAGEVVRQGDLPLASGRGEHEARVERQQRRCGVADGGGRAEVAPEGGAVADQPRGELREDLRQERHRDPADLQALLDLGEGQRGADLDRLGGDRQLAQLGQPVEGDDVRRAQAAQVDLDTVVGGARDRHRLGMVAEQGQCLGQVGRTHERAIGVGDPRDGRRWRCQ